MGPARSFPKARFCLCAGLSRWSGKGRSDTLTPTTQMSRSAYLKRVLCASHPEFPNGRDRVLQPAHPLIPAPSPHRGEEAGGGAHHADRGSPAMKNLVSSPRRT
jgi:hypothetical protein